MQRESELIRCSIMRGGTSKAVFLMANELPADPALRDKTILSLFGSPDARQIDGLGGADSTTSKVAVIGAPSVPDADVDYTFGQVSLTEAFVDYGGNCGNISSAVGPYAIEKGLVAPVEPYTTVRIHLTNCGRRLVAKVPVVDGKPAVEGDCAIGGVPGTGARIMMDWSGVVGAATGRMLPTGQVRDQIEAGGRTYTVSVVDAGNIVIYIKASDLGFQGTEFPDVINADRRAAAVIEEIRGKVCQRLGLVEAWEQAAAKTPFNPFVAIVSPAADYEKYTGGTVGKGEVDIVSRLSVMLAVTKAYPGTATVNMGVASRLEGSVVWDLLDPAVQRRDRVVIGHPTGAIAVTSRVDTGAAGAEGGLDVHEISFERTARMLMDGYAYVRKSQI